MQQQQQHRHPALQVVIQNHGSSSGASHRLPRPLSVDEALQYSPMTSAPVFGLDSIMRPDVGRPSFTSWPRPYDNQLAGKMIDSLDNETQASTGMGESPQLETAREYLQQLLRDDGLTKFNFKIPPTLRSDPPPKQDSQPLSRSQLGPFAKLVLDSSDVKYCCSDSTTCSSKPHPRRSKGFPTPTSSSQPLSPIIKDSSRQNSLSSTPQSKKLPKPIVLIPRLSPSSNIDDVQYIADPSSPKRRKIDSQMEERQDAVQLRDQKEVSDAALVKLQSLLHEIFEAEDHLLPDDSPEALLNNKFFKTPNSISEIGPVLASDIHGQLSKALQKVTDYRRLEDVPSEYIKRIQKICEAPIMVAQSAEFRLESPPSDAETERWVHRLEDVQNILLAITTLLQTMSGNQSTKGLCPEDLIQAIPTSLGQIFDHCIIPVVECRASGKDSTLFSVFTSKKQIISNVIHQTKKVLTRLASFLSNVDLAEGPITAMEFLAARLIFVENAPNDKESAVGVQKYEASRRAAMDVLAKIFAKYPNQRPFILDEILVSLEKLPSNRQSARQFKLIDGKSIQLLSALVIQLVQTTALQLSTRPTLDQNALQKTSNISRTDDLDGSEEEADTEDSDDEKKHKTTAIKRLSKQIDPLYDNAIHSAQYVTKFIVQRAMTSTKTGDQPYRNLLDLFTEDLITVLGSTDWPGAELILRVLASQMITIADHDKSTANAKNMSLELLGWMGSAISDLTSAAQHLSNAIEDGEGDLTEQLRYWLDEHSNRALHIQDIIGLDGPYRMALEFLEQRNLGDWQLSSARGYLVAQWAKIVCSGYEESVQNGAGNAQGVRTLAKTLNHILSGPKWLESNSIFERISTQQARLAYFIIILSSGFCKGFDTIVKVLLSSITSDQAKVRSRSLKSVIQMLERDSGLLDRDESIMALILRSATDSSPMVRDSALGLIAKCMFLKPSLEENCCCAILASSSDQTVGVRKRCITLMKDIYPQTSTHELKLAIIEQLLQRVNDFETTVAGQARLALEDIWFSPLHSSSAGSVQTTPQSKVTLENLMDLIVGTVRGNECVIPAFEAFIKHELSTESKSASSNFAVCKAVVSTMFDRIVHGSENIDKRTLQSLLQSITVFAKANAKLFTPDQLETLHPYIGHLSNADDLILFRSVVVIYRCVLPYLSTSHNTLLKDIQNDLFKSVSKLARTELNEVMACLWTINGVLQNTERLVKLTISVLKGINQAASINSDSSINADALGRVRSYIRIAGCVGKHCDLESFQSFFSHAFPQMKSTSVAGLIVDFISPFASSKYTQELRIMALESLGAVCETWPAQYGREPARTAFTSVFKEDSADLQNIVLKGFLAFFSIHEGKAEKLIETAGVDADGDATRLGGSLKASENDGAAALIAQHFLQQMLHAALSKENSHALTAIELIASVNRQGLIHPKECAGVLVALETSSNTKISSIAFETHKMLHQQHESMFDREYMRAVQEAFYYQRDIVGDPAGALTRPFTAKLAPLFEIIKISNSRYQKKFLTNLCSKVDFEPRKLDINGNPPEQLLLARFVCQNLAFFEYAQIGELLATVTCMERIVASTGTTVAHAIETDIFPVKFENTEHQIQVDNSTAPEKEPQHIDPDTLKQLATAAAALSLLWETRSYLRRLYGISFHSLPKESKAGAKELNKSVSKVQGVSSERLWDAMAKTMACLENAEGMITICREFATLMAIDDELKVTADDDRNGYDSTTELVDVGTIIAPSNGSKLGKRRSSVSSGNAPKRPKQKGKGKNAKKRGSTGSDNDAVLD